MTNFFKERLKMLMKETLVQYQFTVEESDLNSGGILFGGRLMAILDNTMASAAQTLTTARMVTGSVDTIRFMRPIDLGETITIRAQVLQTKKRIAEVLAAVYNSRNKLTNYAVFTFVTVDKDVVLPTIEGQTDIEELLQENFENRVTTREKTHQRVFKLLKKGDL